MSGPGEYGRHIPDAAQGGVVSAVEPGGPADRAGVRYGDTVLSADGQQLRDIIDWQWVADGETTDLNLLRSDGTEARATLVRDLGEAWGISFTEAVFDGVRTCRNSCAFCFMTQLPKGLRKALYLRDDDYRLSFLQGNFITLTNLSDGDVLRIAEQHLSPLYVSLHAVDPQVREELVCAGEDRALARFDELGEAGIDIHVQIVLVPGVNDGPVLAESLDWLAKREGVLSVGIVPLGYTAHQRRFKSSFGSRSAASAVVASVLPWQEAMRERDGCTWVYLADEFYLDAAIDVPSAEHYDGFPQFENGIGMVRDFLDEAHASRSELAAALADLPRGVSVTLATGELFAPVLTRVLQGLGAGEDVAVVGVRNRFFGGNVSVTGLLTTADLSRELEQTSSDGVVLLPDCIANADGVLLDGVSVTGLGTALGREVRLLSCDVGGLLSGLRDVADNPPIT